MAYTRPGVYVTEGAFKTITVSGSTTVPAAFVGTAPRGPITPKKISSWTQYKTLFGDIADAYDLSYAVYHFFVNGGRDAYISRVYNSETTTAASAAFRNMLGTVDGGGSTTLFKLNAENPGAWGNDLTVTVTAGLVTGNTPTFTMVIEDDGTEVERWTELSMDPDSNRYVSTVINTYSTYVSVSNVATYTTSYTVTTVSDGAFASGSDGSAANTSETNTEWTNAVDRLDNVTEEILINMVGMTTASVVNSALTYCENRGDAFLIIDPTTVTSGSEAVSAISGYSASSYGAVYYPKLKMNDPSKTGLAAVRDTLPGGPLLGLYARVEAERTVAKAPAGYAYDVRGALGLVTKFTEAEEGTLYTNHINTMKAIAGGGVVVNGARTLKKTDITKYVPTRRSLNYVKSQVKNLTQFAVFEPNDEKLWTTIQVTLSKFLASFWGSGGLKGRTAAEAFYVLCDSSNNTTNTIENGEVHVEVGVALQTPAEFIVIEVSQFSGGTSATTENV